MTPFRTVEDALQAIQRHRGAPEDFELALVLELLDPTGVSIAILTDAALARGWMPDGFEDRSGYRLYRYKPME